MEYIYILEFILEYIYNGMRTKVLENNVSKWFFQKTYHSEIFFCYWSNSIGFYFPKLVAKNITAFWWLANGCKIFNVNTIFVCLDV